MAIAHWHLETTSRAQGHSAAARLGYDHAARLKLPDGKLIPRWLATSHADDVAAAGVVGWDNNDLQSLADAIEASERRCDARLGRSIVAALPHELSDEQRKKLALGYALWLRDQCGAVVSFLYTVHRWVVMDGIITCIFLSALVRVTERHYSKSFVRLTILEQAPSFSYLGANNFKCEQIAHWQKLAVQLASICDRSPRRVSLVLPACISGLKKRHNSAPVA